MSSVSARVAMFAAVLELALGAPACSYLAVHGPPSRPRPEAPSCTTSRRVPNVDLAGTAVTGAAGGMISIGVLLSYVFFGNRGEANGAQVGILLVAPLVVPAIYGVSTWRGHRKVTRCRAYRRQWERERVEPIPAGPRREARPGPDEGAVDSN